MLVRNRGSGSCAIMTVPPAGSAVTAGGFLTVEQVAQLRQVTPAAIRAQLRAGTLAGEQVRQGQRTVWRIPAGAVPGRPDSGGDRPTARREGTAPPAAQPEKPRPAPLPPGRVEALEAEVRRLRRQLSALTEAHRRLLDTVTAGLLE